MADDEAALQVDILAAGLRGDQKESGNTVEFLAQKFQLILPNHTKIVRGGWILSSEKPVKELTVSFDDYSYQLVVEKHGAVVAREQKLVRGVVLKSNEVTMDQWITLVAESLTRFAQKNASARQALSDFLIGK